MSNRIDGPASKLFVPVPLAGNITFDALGRAGLSPRVQANLPHAPRGECVAWGIPFVIRDVLLVREQPVSVRLKPLRGRWLVFLHTADVEPLPTDEHKLIRHNPGNMRLGEHAATYVVQYADGQEMPVVIRRGYEVGVLRGMWSEHPLLAVADGKPHVLPAHSADRNPNSAWGRLQTRHSTPDLTPWTNYLYAWENPRPGHAIVGLRLEPAHGAVLLMGLAAGRTQTMPLRWETRRKCVLTLPRGKKFCPAVTPNGLSEHLQLDLGQVISLERHRLYPDARQWPRGYDNQLPAISERELLVEYAAHPEARFHLAGGRTIAVASLDDANQERTRPGKRRLETAPAGPIQTVPPAGQMVEITVTDKTGRPVPVRLHVHGRHGEYLAPVDRHRIVNADWFEDYGCEFAHRGLHVSAYIPGQTRLRLPLGRVYMEVSKGFEIRPVRRCFTITRGTRQLRLELEKVLPWREQGWVTADTHVHFLSPATALLEGAAEGVNVVNLLASQWGELMTNAGDFDGRTTFGARGPGADGEHLVRVGTENRQHILGHISLLGYEGPIIAPMTTGGPDESAIGDAVECLLTEWARQCRAQKGIVILPHFPWPRSEHAAALVSQAVDGVEMTSWGDLYGGISAYSLSDWYRYLNCGYFTAAVGGTDKMSAATAVGTVRTYARLRKGQAFSYDAWKQAVRRGETFVTYGPLLEFAVEGRPAGSRLRLPPSGGTLDVTWRAASVTVPISRVDLVRNGEIIASQAAGPDQAQGHWPVKMDRSGWLAVLVRGHHPDKPEIIAAHTSPVMVEVRGSELLAAADALTILEQIQGAMAYLECLGTRAETAARKRMKLVLTAAQRSLHNRLHQAGLYHDHAPGEEHHH